MLIISIILTIVSISLLIYCGYAFKHIHQINKKVDLQNQTLLKEYELNKVHYDNLQNQINQEKEHLLDLQDNSSKMLDTQKELSQKAFENYCKVLDKQYDEYELEYNEHNAILEEAYARRQLELIHEMTEVQKELDKVKATRTAALQAQIREKEIEEKLSFYCLSIAETDIRDIGVLEAVAPKLSKPRVLYMLIWQTFFRTPMTNLCNNIIGTTVKSGIYKITNIKTKECYIGQAVDLASRWKDHAKCGLGIDTPAGNKLYKAMQEYGIWNFSWEILEEVPPAQLNEKEKYYIELYDAKNFGYNSNKGVTT